MVLVLLHSALLAAPPQGVSVQLQRLELVDGASRADGDAVTKAGAEELAKQGYPVIKADDTAAKPKALISGSVKKLKDDRWLVTLTLIRAADQHIIDEVKLEAGDLRQAGVDGVRRLAAEIRATWGVRTTIKL